MSAEPESVGSEVPMRNNPWIGEFVADDGDPVYFIYIEQSVLCSVNTFPRSLFMWFSLYYVFNLEYEKKKNTRDLRVCFWPSRQY